MSLRNLEVAVLLALPVVAAEMPMPGMRIEPSTGGSVFHVKNISPQPLVAFLIELVDYPGSSFATVQDETTGEPIAPGVEKRIPSSNMIVAAAPGYVKILAAAYADGSASGTTEKVTQLIEFRRAKLATARELIARIEKAKAAATPKESLITDLKQWRDSSPEPERRTRYQAAGLRRAAVKALISETATGLETQSLDEVLAGLRKSELALAAVH